MKENAFPGFFHDHHPKLYRIVVERKIIDFYFIINFMKVHKNIKLVSYIIHVNDPENKVNVCKSDTKCASSNINLNSLAIWNEKHAFYDSSIQSIQVNVDECQERNIGFYPKR
jgi:hypothetical protein